MKVVLCALAVGVALAAPACAVEPAAGAPPPPTSAQATYDSAQAAYDGGRWREAAEGFGRLVPPGADRLTGSRAVIAARLGYALLQTGRLAEARALIARALDGLPPGEETDDARLTAAEAALRDLDYAAAIGAYRAVETSADRRGDAAAALNARVGLASALVTVDPRAAAAELDPLLADRTRTKALPRAQLAILEDLRARAAMNAGDTASAARWIERANAETGGLTLTNVSTAQITARTDAAIIYGLRHDDELTRKYLTYTGAGHLKKLDWVGQFDGDLPVCGEGGTEPDDVVVVQLAITGQGEVGGVVPLYVSRVGEVGATFARAVRGWRWDPDLIKTVDPFWRATLALQLSCQTRPRPDALSRGAEAALSDWLTRRGVATTPEDLERPVASDEPRLSETGPAAVAPLLGRASRRGNDRAGPETAVLDANHAPPSAYALLLWRRARGASGSARGVREQERRRAVALSAELPALAARFPADPATAWIRLETALAWEGAGNFRSAEPLLREVLAMPPDVLGPETPVRRVALLHAAIVNRRIGDAQAAEAQLARSGVTADQCLLFDTHPVPSSLTIADTLFPQEAQRWRFEGYVKEGFDISDDGRVAHPRTLVAYPPFIFAKATEAGVRGFRYVPPRIGSTAVGCTGETQTVSFRLPN